MPEKTEILLVTPGGFATTHTTDSDTPFVILRVGFPEPEGVPQDTPRELNFRLDITQSVEMAHMLLGQVLALAAEEDPQPPTLRPH